MTPADVIWEETWSWEAREELKNNLLNTEIGVGVGWVYASLGNGVGVGVGRVR